MLQILGAAKAVIVMGSRLLSSAGPVNLLLPMRVPVLEENAPLCLKNAQICLLKNPFRSHLLGAHQGS